MKGLSKYLFRRNPEILAISISVNPDIYYNIIEVLSDIGFTVANKQLKAHTKVIYYLLSKLS